MKYLTAIGLVLSLGFIGQLLAPTEARSYTVSADWSTKSELTQFAPIEQPFVAPQVVAQWNKVNICEQGGNWHVKEGNYPGGLGISRHNWVFYNGQRDFGEEYAASPLQQITVAVRIQEAAGVGEYVPDQYGCGPGW